MNNKIHALILAIGFIIGCSILGYFYQNKAGNSTVTVKGLAEKHVVADQAWWSITTQIQGNTMDQINKNIAFSIDKIHSFLKENGINGNEIKTDNISIYQNNYRDAAYTFTGDVRIAITSDDINKVDKASRNIPKLISRGILITGDKYSNGPKYFFTKFSEIKPEMIAEATLEAKKSADEFAKLSDTKVSKIIYANQGVFQIKPPNRTNDNEEFYKEKLIRVVSTINYQLD